MTTGVLPPRRNNPIMSATRRQANQDTDSVELQGRTSIAPTYLLATEPHGSTKPSTEPARYKSTLT